MSNNLLVWASMGFGNDPFRNGWAETSDSRRIKTVVEMAVAGRHMVAIVGERGMGKTRAVRQSLPRDVKEIRPDIIDAERVSIRDINAALLLDLSKEKPWGHREVLARQTRRVLGDASTRHQIVLIIEECHLT